MPKATPRRTPDDLAALHALASGRSDISPVSRYWLSVYKLIDETPRGWLRAHVTSSSGSSNSRSGARQKGRSMALPFFS